MIRRFVMWWLNRNALAALPRRELRAARVAAMRLAQYTRESGALAECFERKPRVIKRTRRASTALLAHLYAEP